MYQALYRKYRPKTFDDVVGQEPVTRTLQNEVKNNKTAHAYLFSGSRGTGKTTCSKILAKAVNCPNVRDGNPCGECEICRGIDDGSVLDVLEIDAASNNGVDNIRQLREDAYFAPGQAAWRVYIIDEVHMLSTGAFNALLKIMEEPPRRVLFILATTEVHKVPATILSRCQRFDFRRIDSTVIADRLMEIAGLEGFTLERDAALLIGRLADGAMRDALSLLDLCVSYSDPVDLATVAKAAGVTGRGHLVKLAYSFYDKNTAAALEEIASLYQDSVDMDRLCGDLIGFYRDLMLLKAASPRHSLSAALPEEIEEMRPLAQKLNLSDILYALSVLQEAQNRMGRFSDKRVQLETAAVQLCDPSLDTSVRAVSARLDKIEAALFKNKAAQDDIPVRQNSVTAEKPLSRKETLSGGAAADREPLAGKESSGSSTPRPGAFARWPQVLDRLKGKNPPLYAALGGSSAYEDGDLILIDAPSELFYRLIRENDFAKNSLREALMEETGRRYRLGPYRSKQADGSAGEEMSPVDKLLQAARESGVIVNEK